MRRQTAAVGATLTACGLILGLGGVAASASTVQTAPLNAALRYLYSQVGTDGSVASALGATEDTVISTADGGYDPATLKSGSSGTTAYQYLKAHASTINTAGGAAKYVLAWIAAGRPAAFHAAKQLTKLNTLTTSNGYLGTNGAFHNSNPAIETANAYSQSLAVIADVAAGVSLPAHATGWLVCAQRADGGFGYYITDTTSTPPSSCGDTSSDSNDTAIILQALGAAGVASADAAAETYLHSIQDSDGGFGFPGSGSDPDSDQTVIQALVALGQDPAGSAWTVGGKNAFTNLATFADAASGGYVYPGNTAPDAFTTSGIPQALALKPYGATTSFTTGATPPPAPTPTPTPTSTPPTTALPSPTGGVEGITVPAAGASSDGVPGPAAWVLILGGVGMLASVAGLRRRRSPVP